MATDRIEMKWNGEIEWKKMPRNQSETKICQANLGQKKNSRIGFVFFVSLILRNSQKKKKKFQDI